MITMNRRAFLKTGAAAVGLAALPGGSTLLAADTKPPNILFIITDQLSMDAIAAHGGLNVATPNIDRLVQGGITFAESYSASPVCCPARVSMLTGRMASEHGVVSNTVLGVAGMPTIGEELMKAGYHNEYFGKTHVPGFDTSKGVTGFERVVRAAGHAAIEDDLVSRTVESFIRGYKSEKPFFCVASFVHPHDICYWHIHRAMLVPESMPFGDLASNLPGLPPNKDYDFAEPALLAKTRITAFSDEQWRFYLYNYYRMVEMLDAEIGRVLDALDDSGHAADTLVVMTADHGEGGARHSRVQKWHPYEESAKVPLIARLPGVIPKGTRDTTHLVSGIDLFPTFCDFAGVSAPALPHGRSLKALMTGKTCAWRDTLAIETQVVGRTIRSARYKYVKYKDDPVEMLFDMKTDPWETKNLATDRALATVLADHRAKLEAWYKAPGYTPAKLTDDVAAGVGGKRKGKTSSGAEPAVIPTNTGGMK